MRISIRGTDRGNAVLTALVLVMVLSSVFITLALRINAFKRYTEEYKSGVIRAVEDSNKEIIKRYDIH